VIKLLLEEARSWIGTPWRHNYRQKTIGVDCINFIAACAERLDIDFELPLFYSPSPTTDILRSELEQKLRPLYTLDFTIGNVVAFNYLGIVHHVAIASSSDTIIHASRTRKKVVEERISKSQKLRIIECYALKVNS
jgi:cell wall-associated NlpC family hydrolase